MNHSRTLKRGIAAALCATVGATAGIATGAAATTKKSSTKAKSSQAQAGRQSRPPGGRPGGPAVHEESVVLNKAGTAFITRTEDSGVVVSVSGSDVTIKEGTDKVTYKSVTISVPSGATVVRNGKTAALADLKAGDRVHIEQSSDGANVFAGDASFKPAGGPGHGGPQGPPPAGGQPPASGATGASGATSTN
jgi:hypothetical protein